MEDDLASKHVIRRRWDSFGEPAKNSQDPGEFYMGLKDQTLSWKEIEIAILNLGGYDRRLTGGSLSFRLEDVMAPQIEKNSNGSYAIYHNLNNVDKGEMLLMTILFNEQVQVT